MKKHVFIPVAMLFLAQYSFTQSTIRTETTGIVFGSGTEDMHIQHLGQDVSIYFRNGTSSSGGAHLQLNSSGELELTHRASAPLLFKTAGNERMRIDPIGHIGIGQSTPTARIDLEFSSSNYAEAGARITAPQMFSASQTLPLISDPDLFVIRRRSGTAFKPYMHVKSNGLVGIGTETPDAHFHIVDDNGTDVDAHIEGFTLIDGSQASLLLGSETGASHGEWGIEHNASAGGLNFWKPFGATTGGGNYHLFIKDNGKVSIGLDPTLASTFNGSYKLYVADGIMTEKVRVAIKTSADWMDVVFEDSYDLMPLDEVEQYIDENKHLPGVPSADDVVSEGIDIAEMDATLLKKIEELTLYMIELKQENEAIKKELKELKGE